jgi:hypothetical protein
MLDLIDRYGDRCFFVAHVNSHAFRLMDRLASISDQALQVIECGPMNAETLRDVIMLRHRSTGLTFQVDGRTDEELSMLRFARLFAGHFDYADGLVGTALQAWIAHIDDVQGNTLSIRKPSGKQLDVLEHLRMDWIALLVELILHTRLSFEQLMRITRVPAPNIRRNLTTLCRMGLVVENGQGAFELDRYVHHLVVAHLTERGVLR